MFEDAVFTSESVSDGHPDKICDQISDAILDAHLAQDPHARVAVETAIKSRTLALIGEVTSRATVDHAAVARRVLAQIGHSDGRWGFDIGRLSVIEDITRQSPDIAHGVDRAQDEGELGAGDQGMMFGFACTDTPNLMPLAIQTAQDLMRRQREVRLGPEGAVLGPDAKAQVTVRYRDGRPVAIETIVVSTHHVAGLDQASLRDAVIQNIIEPVVPEGLRRRTEYLVNPAGPFEVGGPVADAGLTGRKIIVDTYGGFGRHGGGAFSGKDPTKVDRSAAYAARFVARDIIRRGLARYAELRVAYAIGRSRPIGVAVDTFGTASAADQRTIRALIADEYSSRLAPSRIIEGLRLRAPIYSGTAAFGHFGVPGRPWEADVHP
jgi:S-adenosylmethionine synthetase